MTILPDRMQSPPGRAQPPDGFRPWMAFTLALTLAALVELLLTAIRTHVLAISHGWQAVLSLGALGAMAQTALLLAAGRPTVVRLLDTATTWIERLLHRRFLCVVLIALLVPTFPAAVFGPIGRYLVGLFPRLLLFWLVVLALATLLRAWHSGPWPRLLLGTALVYGLVHQILVLAPDVTAYPFALEWSEASRFYEASLFWSDRLYGMWLSPPELHPSRYLLQSIPFLVDGLPLWFHRLWQVVLWFALPAGVAVLWVKRLRLEGRWLRLLFGLWVVLFLFEGPVYYHLLVMVVIVLAGSDVRRPWQSSVAMGIASLWAGISRINWFPVPALLAVCLYLLDRRKSGEDPRVSLRWPAAWLVAGPILALASDAAYIRLSAIPPDRFVSSFSSDLLWYRLLPNVTYPPGLLVAILMASAPLALVAWQTRNAWRTALPVLNRVFLAAALAVLFAGGLLVSVKIGGGSNLHNMDAYLVLWMIVGTSLALGPPSNPSSAPMTLARMPSIGHLAFAVGIPLCFVLGSGRPFVHRDAAVAAESLTIIRDETQQAARRGERVLFISQRHLITFGWITSVPLEPEYETVFLSEMAMAENGTYLDTFHAALREHQFGLIVSDRLTSAFQGRSRPFGEENDARVREVSLPLLCSYDILYRFDQPRVDLLVPKSEEAACPD